jgi:hypothetical protein
MSFNRIMVVSIAWMLAVLAIGLVVQVESLRGWFLVGLVALGPSLSLMYFGRALAPTTSEAINDARR